jgi:integrase
MHVWSAAELRTFLTSVESDRLYALWLLVASTGLRRGEALGVRWSDLDLDDASLRVSQTLLDVGHKLTLGAPKTKAGERAIALDAGTVAALRAHRQRQGAEIMAFGRAQWPQHDLVFTREDGEPVHPAWFSRAFDQRVQRVGLPKIRLHDLRHTHATLALRAGVNVKIVSERLGHSKSAITLDTYQHVTPDMQREAAAKIAGVVFGGG